MGETSTTSNRGRWGVAVLQNIYSLFTRTSSSLDVRDAQAPAESPSSDQREAAGEFRLFQRLPIEIQLMIWSYWRDAEGRGNLRHYLCLCKGDTAARVYIAISNQTGWFVDTNWDDYVDPVFSKVRFADAAYTLTRDPPLWRAPPNQAPAWEMFGYWPCRPLFPPVAWVNFERDVFIVGNAGYRLSGQLRAIATNCDAELPRLAPNHWASRIRFLAFDAEYIETNDQTACEEYDGKVLARMDSLKTIYLVFKPEKRKCCILGALARQIGHYRFMDVEAFKRQRTPIHPWQECIRCRRLLGRVSDAEAWVARVRSMLLGAGKEDVEIRAVVDLLF